MGNSGKKRKLKVKIFNKVYKDMQHNIKTVLRRSNDETFSISKGSEITTFAQEMDTNKSLYDKNDSELLSKITILNNFFKNKPELSTSNKTIVWKYIELMYSISKEEKKEALEKKQDFNIGNISEVIGSLLNDNENGGFKDLIKDISSKLENDIGDKDIDQTQIISDLMSGNMNSCGINFQSILDESSKSLHSKVQNGSIDMEQLKQVAEKIKAGLNL
jgi:hypothetical protein